VQVHLLNEAVKVFTRRGNDWTKRFRKIDNRNEQTYDATMGGAAAHIILKIQTKNPIELGDFVAEFTSIASQHDKFIRENHPDLGPEARIYVTQIKKGSIIAELLPFVPFGMFVPEIIQSIEQINAVTEFVRNYRVTNLHQVIDLPDDDAA
jgi:hypothetical protein